MHFLGGHPVYAAAFQNTLHYGLEFNGGRLMIEGGFHLKLRYLGKEKARCKASWGMKIQLWRIYSYMGNFQMSPYSLSCSEVHSNLINFIRILLKGYIGYIYYKAVAIENVSLVASMKGWQLIKGRLNQRKYGIQKAVGL